MTEGVGRGRSGGVWTGRARCAVAPNPADRRLSGKSYMVLRDEVEWVGLVELGFDMLTGASRERTAAPATGFVSGPRDPERRHRGEDDGGELAVAALQESA